MHREHLLIILGILVMLSPYAGLPYGWLMAILPILGVLVFAIGLSLHLKRRTRQEAASTPTHEASRSV